MTHKDYILRIAEDVGQALAQIIYHKKNQDYQGALSLIDELFKQAVGAGSGFIHAISEETLSLSLRFSKVSLKERMPNGFKQVISKPIEHKVVAQLASWPGVPKKCKDRVPVSRILSNFFRNDY